MVMGEGKGQKAALGECYGIWRQHRGGISKLFLDVIKQPTVQGVHVKSWWFRTHLTRAAAAARTRTQRPGKHLAVHASELVVKPDFQILRRYRRPLLLRLEHTHRPTLEDYVHRATRLGSSRSLNLRIGILG